MSRIPVATNIRSRHFKDLVFAKSQNVFCQYCDDKLDRRDATVDHFHPLTRGGSDSFENYRIACSPCNAKKGHEFHTFDPGCLLNAREIAGFNLIGILLKPLIQNKII